MPSRADARGRARLELALRLAALALLGWQLARELAPRGRPSARALTTSAGELRARLGAATLARDVDAVHVRAERPVAAVERAWLRALARSGAGVRVSWSGDLPALAIAAEPTGEPAGGARLLLAGGAPLLVGDAAGAVDSVRPRGGGASVTLATLEGLPWVEAGAARATGAAPDSALARGVVLLGRAAWETRFVAAALEEAGWRVALRTPLAPDRAVEQGTLAFDTLRAGAVVALDSTAAPYAEAIARFVRTGGGLVLGAEAVAAVPALARLAPGAAAAPAAPPPRADTVDRAALPLRAVVGLREGALPLERRGGAVAVAARRAGAGRVAQVGYLDTWRWRMGGGDEGAAAHRRWWSALLARVAYLPTVRREAAGADPAPLAAMVDALGPAAAPTRGTDGAPGRPPRAVVLVAILTLLLAEWLSRRLRGAR